jgi:hypothetical protein
MTTTNITSTDPKIAANERLYARLRRDRLGGLIHEYVQVA